MSAELTKTPEKQTVVVSFRVKKTTQAKLLRKAEAARMSPRAWLEEAVLTNATKIELPKDETILRALLFQVARAGNNLNQVAYKINRLDLAGKLTPGDVSDGIDVLRDISVLLHKALARAR